MTDGCPCGDCGAPTCDLERGGCEWYMVRRSVWRQAGGVDGYLCVGCLEARLGRRLSAIDFTVVGANFIGAALTSERLRDRRRGLEDRPPTPEDEL